MTQKKANKTIRIRDLEPAKDAKGGRHHRGHRHTSLLNQKEDPHAPDGGYGIHMVR